uniref:Cytochrome P450 n=1 Tax=Timema tahoe TaxID=61484 RepID=A0A7R9P038_9NEOP|nr:unnamed protein product [Timema tahoe]
MDIELPWIIILAAVVAVIFLYQYFTSTFSYWEKRGVPFVKHLPAFGNVADSILLQNTLAESGSTPNLIIRDPVIIKQIMVKDFNHFIDRNPSFVEKISPLACNLFSLTGNRWRKLRMKLTPTFTSGKMRMMLPTIVGCSQNLVSFLGESADDNHILEIRNVVANFTTDVIGSCAFGLNINSMKNPNSEFRRMGNKVFQPTHLTGALRSLVLIFRPILRFVLPPVASKDVNDFFLGMVKETMSYREKNKVVRNDFLQLLIQLKNKGMVDEDLVSKMTDTLLAAQCFVFFLAGFETSSTTISCCLHELAVNPDIQERLRKEVDKVLIRHGGKITHEALHELEYMDAVVDETLRKYPPVGNLTRFCIKAYQMPGTNVKIDKETRVIIPVYAIHHDPKYYPDPEKFDPERFSDEHIKSRPNFTYLPFGEGPRICIGLRFSRMQVKVGLTALLSKYKFSVCKKTSIPLTFNPISFITLWPQDIHLKISNPTAVIVFLYLYFTSTFSYWEKRGVPFVKPLPVFGNFVDYIFLRTTSAESFAKIYKKLEEHQFGGFYRGSTPNLILRDPEIIKQIMVKDFNHFIDRNPSFFEKISPLACNLISLTGNRWRKLRMKLTPTFTSGKMRMMLPTIVGCSQDLVLFLRESADDNHILEIRNVVANFTTDVIGSCAFGLDINSMKNPDSEFRRMGNKVLQPTLLTVALRSLVLIFRPILKLVRHPLVSKDVNDFFLGMVKETLSYREKNKVVRNDFLQLLIQLKNKGKVDEDLVSKMTDTLLAAQCFVFFLAGFDTSSTTISCCLHELAVNPDIQERLRKEVDKVLIRHGGKITYEALQDLKYMDSVVDETLRKYPPVGYLTRFCTKAYRIPGTNVRIDKETIVIIPLYAIHHDPKYYPEPEKFDPERFSEDNIKSRPNFTYLPFGEGPRICIGRRFGLMQVKVGLTALLSKYKFSVCEKTSIPLTFNPISCITLWPRDIHLKISHRDN